MFYVTPKRTNSKAQSWKHLKKAVKLFCYNKLLKKYALLQIIDRSVDLTTYRFEGLYLEGLISNSAISLFRLIQQGLGCVSFYVFKYVKKIGLINLLFYSVGWYVLVRVIAFLLNNIITPFIMVFDTASYGITATAESTLVQNEFSNQQRATMGSLIAMAERIIGAFLFYLVGVISDFYNPLIALSLLLIIRLCIALSYKIMSIDKN